MNYNDTGLLPAIQLGPVWFKNARPHSVGTGHWRRPVEVIGAHSSVQYLVYKIGLVDSGTVCVKDLIIEYFSVDRLR